MEVRREPQLAGPEAQGTGLRGYLQRLGRPDPDILLAEHACELLSDQADWDDDVWDLTPAGVAHLANELSKVLTKNAGVAIVTALWEGDKSSRDVEVSREDLIELVRSNGLGNKVRYRVHA